MVRDYLGTLCLRCNRNDFTALTFVKSTCCRTQATSLQNLIPNRHSNTNKKCPNWDIFHWWRMVRDSNPRTSCPVSGFQDRRIRPLCQPSETFIRATLLQTGGFGAAYDFIILAPRFAVKTVAFDRSANHPKLSYVRRSCKPAVLVLRMISSSSHRASQSRRRFSTCVANHPNLQGAFYSVFFKNAMFFI